MDDTSQLPPAQLFNDRYRRLNALLTGSDEAGTDPTFAQNAPVQTSTSAAVPTRHNTDPTILDWFAHLLGRS
jgi:hypothetical protein